MIVEAAFLERARAAIAGTGNVEHLIVVDAAAEDAIALDELERAEPGADSTSRRPGGRCRAPTC